MMNSVNGTRILLLFTRSPQAEARLKGLPGEAGARLFAALLRSWAQSAREVGARLVVSAPGACMHRLRALGLDPEAEFLLQKAIGFGARLEEAARAAFATGAGAVVLAGGDVPAPEARMLEAAFRALESGAPAVLGPSRDGGVYLIGLPGHDEGLLRRIRPRDPGAFRQCLGRLSRHGGAPLILGERPDLDCAEDAGRLARGGSTPEAWAPFEALLGRVRAPEAASRPARTGRAAPGHSPATRLRGPPRRPSPPPA
jgi:glycosyltransferase A (GT-A) superfamily protein (DUF2064 family)